MAITRGLLDLCLERNEGQATVQKSSRIEDVTKNDYTLYELVRFDSFSLGQRYKVLPSKLLNGQQMCPSKEWVRLFSPQGPFMRTVSHMYLAY